MPIIHYPGYITKEQAAAHYKVQLRTINDWIQKRRPAPEGFFFIRLGDYTCIKDPSGSAHPPTGIAINTLEWVRSFAKRNKMNFERVYEDIIMDKITGVILADRIFVINTEPRLIDYVSKYKPQRRDLGELHLRLGRRT